MAVPDEGDAEEALFPQQATKMKGETRRVTRGTCDMGKREMERKSTGYLWNGTIQGGWDNDWGGALFPALFVGSPLLRGVSMPPPPPPFGSFTKLRHSKI